MPALGLNPTVARMASIARNYGPTRGMLGCSITTPDTAMAIFALVKGYVIVTIAGETHTAGYLSLKDDALDAWWRYVFGTERKGPPHEGN